MESDSEEESEAESESEEESESESESDEGTESETETETETESESSDSDSDSDDERDGARKQKKQALLAAAQQQQTPAPAPAPVPEGAEEEEEEEEEGGVLVPFQEVAEYYGVSPELIHIRRMALAQWHDWSKAMRRFTILEPQLQAIAPKVPAAAVSEARLLSVAHRWAVQQQREKQQEIEGVKEEAEAPLSLMSFHPGASRLQRLSDVAPTSHLSALTADLPAALQVHHPGPKSSVDGTHVLRPRSLGRVKQQDTFRMFIDRLVAVDWRRDGGVSEGFQYMVMSEAPTLDEPSGLAEFGL